MVAPVWWPDDFRPSSGPGFSPVEGTTDGGVTVSGDSLVYAEGRGRWRADFKGFRLLDPQRVRLWRALEVRIRGRAGAISLPLWDEWQAAVPGIASPASVRTTGIHFSDGATHSDGSGHGQPVISAALRSPWALNATTLRMEISGADPEKIIGSHFSLWSEDVGDRAYRVADADWLSDTLVDLVVWPWARSDYPAGTRVECARPRCLMRLEEDDTMRIADLDGGRWGSAGLACLEYPA